MAYCSLYMAYDQVNFTPAKVILSEWKHFIITTIPSMPMKACQLDILPTKTIEKGSW